MARRWPPQLLKNGVEPISREQGGKVAQEGVSQKLGDGGFVHLRLFGEVSKIALAQLH